MDAEGEEDDQEEEDGSDVVAEAGADGPDGEGASGDGGAAVGGAAAAAVAWVGETRGISGGTEKGSERAALMGK